MAHRRTYFFWRYYWSNLDPFFLCLQGKHAQNAVEGQRQLLCQSVKLKSQAGAIGLKAIAHWLKCIIIGWFKTQLVHLKGKHLRKADSKMQGVFGGQSLYFRPIEILHQIFSEQANISCHHFTVYITCMYFYQTRIKNCKSVFIWEGTKRNPGKE